MVIYHIDMVIRDIDMGYGLMIWEIRQYRYGHLPYRHGVSCHSARDVCPSGEARENPPSRIVLGV